MAWQARSSSSSLFLPAPGNPRPARPPGMLPAAIPQPRLAVLALQGRHRRPRSLGLPGKDPCGAACAAAGIRPVRPPRAAPASPPMPDEEVVPGRLANARSSPWQPGSLANHGSMGSGSRTWRGERGGEGKPHWGWSSEEEAVLLGRRLCTGSVAACQRSPRSEKAAHHGGAPSGDRACRGTTASHSG